MHIKARLLLLRNGQSTGMPNQHAAPVPQDVHPQQYQAAGVGAPPGPQWGAPGPAPGPHGHVQPIAAPVSDWNRQLAAIETPQRPPPAPYDQRDAMRPLPPPRPQSPRVDQLRYSDRHTPGRRPSPSPNMNHIAPNSYPGPPGLPQPAPLQPPPAAPTRITNPNYGAPNAGIAPPPPNGGHAAPNSNPPYGRGNSPPPEIRPLVEDRPSSPGYPRHPYHHQSNNSQTGGIAAGAPPPVAALAAAEAAARDNKDDRLGVGVKRSMDVDDDYKMANKKPANGDTTRGRHEEHYYSQASPVGGPSSPRDRAHPRSASELQRDDQRRTADDNYHPSQAAHHPPTLPSLHPHPEPQPPVQALPPPPPPQPQHLPPMVEPPPPPPRTEPRDLEPAIRKVELDDDYNDDGEDEKRLGGSSGGRSSPPRSLLNGPTKMESQVA